MPGKRIVRKKVRRSGSKVNKALKRYVKSTLSRGLETKSHTYEYSTSVTTTATVVDLTDLNQNVTGVGRIGNEIDVKNVEMIYNLIVNSTDAINTFRVLIFQWHPNNAVDLPQTAEIFDFASAGVGWECYAPFNHDKRKLFTIYYDKVHSGSYGSDSGAKNFRKKRIGPFKPTQYDYAVNTGTNHIYLLYISDSGATPHPSINISLGMKYKDA